MIAALILAFHLIPAPADVKATPEFALQGYTVPAACSVDQDVANACPRTVTDAPVFEPETDQYRPMAEISFVAPFDGECIAAETETDADGTQFVPSNQVDAVKGQRVYVRAGLIDRDEADGMAWGPLTRKRYRIAVVCGSDSEQALSSFYEVAVPGAS